MEVQIFDGGLFLLNFAFSFYVGYLRKYNVLAVANDIDTLEVWREELTIAALKPFFDGGLGRQK